MNRPTTAQEGFQAHYSLGLRPGQAAALCAALLMITSLLASFPLACITPFAAFAAVAALMLPLGSALLVTFLVWVVNQAIGFGLMGYPFDAGTAIWGLAIGAAALLATVAAGLVLPHLRMPAGIAALVALIAAFVVYELPLAALATIMGGSETFAADVVTRVAVLNLLFVGGLLVVLELARAAWRLRGGSTARA
jgi:hypothetical protein